VAEHPFGVLTNVPLTWLALAVPLILWNRSATTRSMLRCFLGAVAVLFGICALTIGLYFTMCLRYEVEFAGVLVFLATIGILGLERVLASQPAWRRLARFGWVLLLAFSTAFNLLASLGLRADARTNLGAALLKRREVDPAISAFQEALKIKPEDVAARIGLGAAFRQKGRLDEAIAQYQLALRIQPDEAQAWINLGNIFQKKGDLAEAIAKYQKALQISPESAEAHYDLASAFRQNGRTDDVISQLEEALQSSPYFVEARYNLGNALFQKGRLDEAIAQYQKALEIKPDYAQAHYNLGNALLQKGRDGEAISHFEQALQIEPNDPKVQNNLAWLLAISPQASLRDGGKAVELARRANAQTGGNNPFILRTLAAALAETGQFSEAVDTAQRAARLAGEQSETALGAQLQSEMELYRRARPFHDPGQIH
jgi:tetratricopeptide (TPR) repeat protein